MAPPPADPPLSSTSSANGSSLILFRLPPLEADGPPKLRPVSGEEAGYCDGMLKLFQPVWGFYCAFYGWEAREAKKSSSFLDAEGIDGMAGKSESQPEEVPVGVVKVVKGSDDYI
jgi:hypothetical protein